MMTVRLKLSRNQLKYIAFITMLIDHVGFVLFPGCLWFRMIGRLSFPLFAYLIADGAIRTSNQSVFLARLFCLAIISEPFFDLAVKGLLIDLSYQNIFFTLFLGASFCEVLRKESLSVWIKGFIFLIFFAAAQMMCFDYGAYGFALIVMFAVFQSFPTEKRKDLFLMLIFAVYFLIMSIFGSVFLQWFAAFAILFLPYEDRQEKPMSKLWYFFYPVHLLLLFFLKTFMC